MGLGDIVRKLWSGEAREAAPPADVRAPTEEAKTEKRDGQPGVTTVAWVAGAGQVSGTPLNNESAQRIAAYSSCVNVVSQDMAKLPCEVIDQEGGTKRVAKEHHVHRLLAVRPNPMMTPFKFKQFVWRCLMYRGNAFIQIVKTPYGKPIALYPIHPDSVKVRKIRNEEGLLVKVFDVAVVNGRPVTLPDSEVMHLMWDTEDGITGNSPIKQHALALGWAFTMAEFGQNFFNNGAHASLVVTIPETMSDDPEQQQNFKNQFERDKSGVDKAGKPFYVETGGKVETISVTPEAAQYLDSRKFSRSEIAGISRVPSHKIGDNADMKYSNAEMQEQAYKNDALLPWAVQFEEEALLKLFTEEEQTRYVVRWDFNGLLRADRKSRAEAHKIEIESGEKQVNEIRAENGDPPIEGGSVNLVPLNYSTYQAMNQNGWVPLSKPGSPAVSSE